MEYQNKEGEKGNIFKGSNNDSVFSIFETNAMANRDSE